jgi:DNA invertase Pin-like site-specific DNA recombinase
MKNPGECSRKIGRPRVEVPTGRVLELRDAGQSWRAIGRTLRLAVTTIRRAYQAATNGPTPYQNSGMGTE